MNTISLERKVRLPNPSGIKQALRLTVLFFCLSSLPVHADTVAPSPAETAPTSQPTAMIPAEPAGGAPSASPANASPVIAAPPSPQAQPATSFPATQHGGFSPIALYQQADIVGKSVILLLIFGSLLSWTLWLLKTWEVALHRRRVKASVKLLAQATSLHNSTPHLSAACVDMLTLAKTELETNSGQYSPPAHIKERVHARIQRTEAAEVRVLTRGASILATTSAVAPFIGLFGTVWGIMHSFISIAQSQSTNLSVVAPGIAEALFATALGLIVAVPSVIFYNMISRQISGYRMVLTDASTLTMCLLSQELDRQNSDAQLSVHHKDSLVSAA
ncbi:tonB-system energizer ExbB [Pectobacterium polaris]|uniref:tonB-system energizer ExbB n=1 Tax=Pectobacterium polaris TaxID=2042057 RepID=UPI0020C69D06|nr:tonB-system energizer ExbB [Pectobacterium polaris]